MDLNKKKNHSNNLITPWYEVMIFLMIFVFVLISTINVAR